MKSFPPERANYTIKLLGLNTRGALIEEQKNAARFYIEQIEKYVNAKKSTNLKLRVIMSVQFNFLIKQIRNLSKQMHSMKI